MDRSGSRRREHRLGAGHVCGAAALRDGQCVRQQPGRRRPRPGQGRLWPELRASGDAQAQIRSGQFVPPQPESSALNGQYTCVGSKTRLRGAAPPRQLGQDVLLLLRREARPSGDLLDRAEAALAPAGGGVEHADGGAGREGRVHEDLGGATMSASLVWSVLVLVSEIPKTQGDSLALSETACFSASPVPVAEKRAQCAPSLSNIVTFTVRPAKLVYSASARPSPGTGSSAAGRTSLRSRLASAPKGSLSASSLLSLVSAGASLSAALSPAFSRAMSSLAPSGCVSTACFT